MKEISFSKDFRKYKKGTVHKMPERFANIFIKMGIASYDTKVMDQPVVVSKPIETKITVDQTENDEGTKKKRGRKPKSDKTYDTRMMEAE